jgi:hypothetical protein
LRVRDVCRGDGVAARAIVLQQKTQRRVQFEITPPTREVVTVWIKQAGAKVELKPGGYHVMLMELKQPLKNGDRFPLTLTFEKAGKIEVSVWAEDMASTGTAEHKH